MKPELLANVTTAPMPVGSGDWLDPKIVNADCLIEMPKMPAQSVDAIISDLPYGTTCAPWDSVLPLATLWAEWKRLLKPGGAIVLTASQPFSSVLGASNLRMLKYSWVWEKSKASNFLLARKQPLKAHEDILVFCDGTPTYNPQKTKGEPFKGAGRSKKGSQTELVNNVPNPTFRNDNNGDRFPRSVQYFVTAESEGCLHPTQKPVALMRYLVRTHTNPGDVVLDVACGSGTTCLAAMLEGRKSIGIEKDEQYAKIAINRIHEARGLGV